MNNAVNFFSNNAGAFAASYAKEPDFRERFQLWTALLDRYVVDGARVIDMGCGSGVFSFYLADKGMRVTGIDGAEGMIELCEKNTPEHLASRVQFMHDEVPLIQPSKLEKADLIISSSLLEYVDALQQTLDGFHTLLNDGGLLIFSLPNADSLHRKYEKIKFKLIRRPRYYEFVKNVLTLNECETLLKQIGFTMIDYRYYAHNTWISRFCSRLGLGPRYSENLFVAVFRLDGAKNHDSLEPCLTSTD